TNSVESVAGVVRRFHTAGVTDKCPNAALPAETHSQALPDCRAYELATPADKAGGDVIPWSLRVQAAADGSAVEYSSLSSFADPKGTSLSSEYIAERTGAPGTSGWSTHNITPATEPLPPYGFFSVIPAYMGEFSADLN